MIKLNNRADDLAARINAEELENLYRAGLRQFREDLGADPIGPGGWEIPVLFNGESVDLAAAIESGYREIYRAGILAGIDSMRKQTDDDLK